MSAAIRPLIGRALALVAAPLLALMVAAIATSVVLVVAGAPLGEFWEVITRPPTGRSWINIVNQSSMIFMAAMAAAVGFRMNLFNIGVEGQYTVASYLAALVAGFALFPGKLNIAVAIVVAMATGAIWAGIAGLLKVTRGVSEVISTIMLNAIAITLVGWAVNTYGDKYGQGRRTTPLEESSTLAGWELFEARDGRVWSLAVLAVLVGVVMWFLIGRTRFGFDLRATGLNEDAAVASGVEVKKMVVISMLISGAIAGLIWMPALFGGADYYGSPFQRGLGFTGIAVALLGRNRPLGVAIGAVLFAWLNEQANPLGLLAGISPSVVQISQGVVVLAVVIAYELVRRRLAAAEQRALRADPPPPEGEPAAVTEKPS
ncbi:MAG: ABC transporter permease [Nocardioides sp.]